MIVPNNSNLFLGDRFFVVNFNFNCPIKVLQRDSLQVDVVVVHNNSSIKRWKENCKFLNFSSSAPFSSRPSWGKTSQLKWQKRCWMLRALWWDVHHCQSIIKMFFRSYIWWTPMQQWTNLSNYWKVFLLITMAVVCYSQRHLLIWWDKWNEIFKCKFKFVASHWHFVQEPIWSIYVGNCCIQNKKK